MSSCHRRAFVINHLRAEQRRQRAVIRDVQIRIAHDAADFHQFAHLRILEEEVRLAQVAERLMGEKPREGGIQNNGLAPARHLRGGQKLHGTLHSRLGILLAPKHHAIVVYGAKTLETALNQIPLACNRA